MDQTTGFGGQYDLGMLSEINKSQVETGLANLNYMASTSSNFDQFKQVGSFTMPQPAIKDAKFAESYTVPAELKNRRQERAKQRHLYQSQGRTSQTQVTSSSGHHLKLDPYKASTKSFNIDTKMIPQRFAGTTKYCCAKCKVQLFSNADLVEAHHMESNFNGSVPDDPFCNQSYTVGIKSALSTCACFFVKRLNWVDQQKSQVVHQGPIKCFNCNF